MSAVGAPADRDPHHSAHEAHPSHVRGAGVCACGKVAYSYTDAQRVAKRKRRRTDERVGVYRCGRSWHVGHGGRRLFA